MNFFWKKLPPKNRPFLEMLKKSISRHKSASHEGGGGHFCPGAVKRAQYCLHPKIAHFQLGPVA